ncbi:HNH endonuclease [Mycobacterium phage Tripl3t]|uniref:HNH endonuclease n=1 Tax=Mycobacterium phage Trouble TaxID=1340825 RepID=UPI000387FDE9|nr:HNH endonuclease [Mycobacterium phage Trouble]YP_009021575.1 HNH endonuclease [Mycobacterium phage Alsfro]QBI97158.1 HNH endonuclease [Mycobacterium phage Tripl3t]QGJ89322.1 HNH endonuclease [Mycobacterium phage Watermelon]AGT12518.1 HNH domain protein [Mycobacterium phage Trouble]AHK12058.1 hypothetical protein PBI_ALSFRO_7 [Mycobacterium phage Alsfro]
MSATTSLLSPVEVDRFWDKVLKTDDGCWTWTGWKNDSGYGRLRHEGRSYRAHRVSYEMHKGPIPDKHDIDHMCFNRLCVNPAHLRACTRKQNLENLSSARASSRTGVRGVSYKPGWRNPYQAGVKSGGKWVYIKSFGTLEEAESAVIEARRKFFTHSQD